MATITSVVLQGTKNNILKVKSKALQILWIIKVNPSPCLPLTQGPHWRQSLSQARVTYFHKLYPGRNQIFFKRHFKYTLYCKKPLKIPLITPKLPSCGHINTVSWNWERKVIEKKKANAESFHILQPEKTKLHKTEGGWHGCRVLGFTHCYDHHRTLLLLYTWKSQLR